MAFGDTQGFSNFTKLAFSKGVYHGVEGTDPDTYTQVINSSGAYVGTFNPTNITSSSTFTITVGSVTAYSQDTSGIVTIGAASGVQTHVVNGNLSQTFPTANSISSLSVTHSDSTSGGSHARFNLETNGASGGDPFVQFNINGVLQVSMGLDNSDSDTFKISFASGVLGTNDFFKITTAGIFTIGAASSVQTHLVNGNIATTFPTAGTASTFSVTHSDSANAGSHARLTASSTGAGGGDPYVQLNINGAFQCSLGIDNDDSDTFKISMGSGVLGTGDMFTITTAGLVTIGTGTTNINRINGATQTAGTDTMTLTNGPAGTAGNPDVFIKLNYNGTVYVLPAWTPT